MAHSSKLDCSINTEEASLVTLWAYPTNDSATLSCNLENVIFLVWTHKIVASFARFAVLCFGTRFMIATKARHIRIVVFLSASIFAKKQFKFNQQTTLLSKKFHLKAQY